MSYSLPVVEARIPGKELDLGIGFTTCYWEGVRPDLFLLDMELCEKAILNRDPAADLDLIVWRVYAPVVEE